MKTINRLLFALTLALSSQQAFAAPELVSQSEIQYGEFQLIETVEITGDITDSLLTLVNSTIKHKDTDFYVIKDISEDTHAETLTVIVSLYNQNSSMAQSLTAS